MTENAMVQDGHWYDAVEADKEENARRDALDAEADRTEDEHKANSVDFAGFQRELEEYKRTCDASIAKYQNLIIDQQALIERLQAALEGPP